MCSNLLVGIGVVDLQKGRCEVFVLKVVNCVFDRNLQNLYFYEGLLVLNKKEYFVTFVFES